MLIVFDYIDNNGNEDIVVAKSKEEAQKILNSYGITFQIIKG